MSSLNLFAAMDISASGMSVQRQRLNVIASNMANVTTTRTPEGGPYRRQEVIMREAPPVFEYQVPPPKRYLLGYQTDPSHFFIPGIPPLAEERIGHGAQVDYIHQDTTPPRMIFDPDHPDADENGYVAMPNIDIITEMVDMISATRAYEANVTALNASKNMALRAMDIGRA